MKKTSVLLVLVMLLNILALPVSAATLTNLFTTSTLTWGNWSSLTANLLDGDASTSSNFGVHSAGSNGTVTFKVSDSGTVKYNKFKIDVSRFNTSLATLKSSSTLSDTEPTASGKSTVTLSGATTLATYTPSAAVSTTSGTMTFSFDTTTDKYLQFVSTVSDASANGFLATEAYLYYATPSTMSITTIPDFTTGTGGTHNAKATIYDADGDVLKDSTLNGVTWAINDDATGVSISSTTGAITVSASAPAQTVTVTATAKSKTSVKATKTFKIEGASLNNLFSSSTVCWSNWSSSGANLVDGDATTFINLGQHTAGGNGAITFKVSNDGSVKYNKLKIAMKYFNTNPATISSGNTLDGTEPTTGTKSTVLLSDAKLLTTYTTPTTFGESTDTVKISFDASTDKYLQFLTTYVDSTALGFQAYEMSLYYATPVGVKINSTIPDFVYGVGGSANVQASVIDAESDAIKDSNLNKLTWSLNSGATGVTIDKDTGKITVSKDAPVQTVTVMAALASNTALHATKTFKVTAPAMTNLLTTSSKVWSPWSGTLCANLLDGDDTTFYNAGEHSAGSPGRIIFKVSDDNSVKYNKVSIDVTRFNSTAYALSSSDTLNGTEPETNTTSTVNLSSATSLVSQTLETARTDVTSETLRFTFDTTDDKYLKFENTVAESSPTYGIRIPEFRLYYATPAKIDMSLSKSRILVGTAETITASATVKDGQGDVLNDSTLNGVVWSLNSGAEGVTIDSATGTITVSEEAPVQDVTVTVKSAVSEYSGILATKTVKISDTAEPSFYERVEDGTITDVSLEVAQDNKTVAAMLSFTATEQLSTPYMVILALYDANNELVGLEINQQSVVNSGRTVTKASKAMSSTYSKVKAYAWDEKLAPLSVVKEHTPKTVSSLKILSIGNSLGEDAKQFVYQIAQDMGIEDVVVAHMHIGGCTLEKHWTNAQNDNATYTYYKNTTGTWTSTANTALSTAIKDEDWDFISLQQNGNKAGDPTTFDPYLANLIDYINTNKTNANAKVVWHMTWAYRDGDTSSTNFAPYNYDQITMYNAIMSTTKAKIVPNGNISIIMPAGTSIQNVRSSFIGDTVTRDICHLTYNTGRYIGSMTWVKALTGLSIDNVTYVPNSTEITASKLDIIKKAVNAADKTPFAITTIGTGTDDGVTNN